MSWAVGVIAPWCLGMGLLVSFTADAGQNAGIGGSRAILSADAPGEPAELIPGAPSALKGKNEAFDLADLHLLKKISLELGTPADYADVPDEDEPRLVLKRGAGLKSEQPSPTLDRSRKGNPAIGLRPTFDTKLRRPVSLADRRLDEVLAPHDDEMPAASFSLQDEGSPLDGAIAFAPWDEGQDPQDTTATARAEKKTIAMQPAALKTRLSQGATPKVFRADALSSATPAPADRVPIEVSLATPSTPSLVSSVVPALGAADASIVPRFGGRPNYAALLAGDRGARERKCLAEAVYFEARSEPEEGQAAVAQVVLNRATSGLYPGSICGVVYQNRSHYKACQFSFACEGKSLRITEPDAWRTAARIADDVVAGKTYLSDVGGATHYHANYVRPGWSRRLVKMDVIGHHVFYKLRQGQT